MKIILKNSFLDFVTEKSKTVYDFADYFGTGYIQSSNGDVSPSSSNAGHVVFDIDAISRLKGKFLINNSGFAISYYSSETPTPNACIISLCIAGNGSATEYDINQTDLTAAKNLGATHIVVSWYLTADTPVPSTWYLETYEK